MSFTQNVFLVLNMRGVDRMTKTMPRLARGEIVVKCVIKASSTAFREPTLVREIVVTDPFDGLIPDIEFSQPFITEAEAAQIKAQRVTRMVSELEDLGYKVDPPPPLPAEPFTAQETDHDDSPASP